MSILPYDSTNACICLLRKALCRVTYNRVVIGASGIANDLLQERCFFDQGRYSGVAPGTGDRENTPIVAAAIRPSVAA